MAKYNPFEKIKLENREWPENSITHAPVWCSVDLRDGNQALSVPMNVEQKLAFFDMLVKIGFKEIEVGFPSASQTEYCFLRRLIEENHIPEDVTIQVLCQAREHLIIQTMESLKGASKAIFHIYNSTSPSQRKYTFNMSKDEIIAMAVHGVELVKKHEKIAAGVNIQLEYSPESFSSTEIDYSVKICEAVQQIWKPTENNKIIFNLPTTVECATPNIYADQIEYFCKHISHRENVVVSTHCHNDRGTGVASCELALLAGAERVEGCLFGNGERTGNLDIITTALNMYTHGIDTGLDFSDLPEITRKYIEFTDMDVPPRQPYAGSLVFTAFSGSHQDAIRKAMAARKTMDSDAPWDVTYIPIDPHDIGREYEEIIRINSQSGKGGAAWILEQNYGIFLPKAMHPVLGKVVTSAADQLQRELSAEEIYQLFNDTWLEKSSPLKIIDFAQTYLGGDQVQCRASVSLMGEILPIGSSGNGPLDAFVSALQKVNVPKFSISAFHEHAIGSGTQSEALACVEITLESNQKFWGCGKSTNIGLAGINGVVSAINQVYASN
ncbi:MAG: 2-isopropylmalate synthase [Treponemataceae bacterium]|nr:2-isopropylmalate synthase [Treponemataceae bacterium]